MPVSNPKWDKRLLGTWKSDRRRTFQHWKPKPNCPPSKTRKFKAIFGRLTVRWERGKLHSAFEEPLDVQTYRVVASDDYSVVIQLDCSVFGERLVQIHFEGDDYYYLDAWGFLEYFKRVE